MRGRIVSTQPPDDSRNPPVAPASPSPAPDDEETTKYSDRPADEEATNYFDRPTDTCASCGRYVADEAPSDRPGAYVCTTCREEPTRIIRRLLELARSDRGDLLAVRGYVLEEELGRGGMGAVYRARHERTGEHVALKVMVPRIRADQRARDLFLREAALVRALRHPHIVEMLDQGCCEGTFFFTMAYCDGGSVDRLVKTGGPLSVAEAGPIILQVLDGLAYAHQAEVPEVRLADGSCAPARGVVHRDVKPSNILLSGTGPARVAKLADFGLAKAFDLAGLSGFGTRTGAMAGTPAFMNRQQVVRFKYAQPDVDVWAAAASLYFLLTGHPPRDFPPDRDHWGVVLETEPLPIRQRQPALPRRLAEVIDAALLDKPRPEGGAGAFRQAGEFKQALEQAL
jgi:serine/threonine protein kinase